MKNFRKKMELVVYIGARYGVRVSWAKQVKIAARFDYDELMRVFAATGRRAA